MLLTSCGSAEFATRADPTTSSTGSATSRPSTHGGRWRTLAPAPPGADGAPVWTGHELIVWSGAAQHLGDPVATGLAYNPADDRWREVPAGPLQARHGHTAVWTGGEVIYWGGEGGKQRFAPQTGETGEKGMLSDGAAFNPVTGRWRKL